MVCANSSSPSNGCAASLARSSPSVGSWRKHSSASCMLVVILENSIESRGTPVNVHMLAIHICSGAMKENN